MKSSDLLGFVSPFFFLVVQKEKKEKKKKAARRNCSWDQSTCHLVNGFHFFILFEVGVGGGGVEFLHHKSYAGLLSKSVDL